MNRKLLFALAALAAVSLTSAATPAHAQIAPASRLQMEHISVEIVGAGSPVILVPGLSSPRAAWEGVVPALAKTHSVYLVQVNGFAGDDPRANLKPGILDGIVADLRTLIATHKLAAPALVGHSMGGLAASYGKPADPAAAEANVAGMTLNPANRERLKRWAMASDPRVAAQAMYEDLTTDMRPELAAIQAPVTVVYAWNDSYPRQAPAEAFFRAQYAGVPRIRYTEAGKSAHFVMLDQPGAFQARLVAFLGE